MNDRDKQRALERAQRDILRGKIALLRNTQTEIDRLLTVALGKVRELLQGQPSDYERWQLPQLERELQRALESWRAQATTSATGAQDRAWQMGRDLVDRPLEAAGIRIAGVAPVVTQNQLQALKSFMTDRIRDVSAQAINRINTQLGLVVIGAQDPHAAIKNVANILGDQTLDRARRIVRTEVGRAFSVANQARMDQAAKNGVPMDKVWRRSGKPHQRANHAMADGQRVPYDEPFRIISRHGEIISLMFPRDPKAPAEETINCGCDAIPRVRGWASTKPDQVPFSKDELAKNPELRKLAASRPKR